MSRYEVVYLGKSLHSRSEDHWHQEIENIDGKIVEPVLVDGTTKGFVVDTGVSRTNE